MSDARFLILVRSGGVVSLLKDLTEDEARGVMQRLRPGENPWTDAMISHRATLETTSAAFQQAVAMNNLNLGIYPGGVGRMLGEQAASLSAECWSPTGEILEVWPKPDDYDVRLQKALDVARQVNDVNRQIQERRQRATTAGSAQAR